MPKSIVEQLTASLPEKVVHVQILVPATLHREVSEGLEKLRAKGIKTSWQKMLVASAQAFRDEVNSAS